MVRYRRNRAAGGTFFLTVTLSNRRSSLLTEHISALRSAIAGTRKQQPFTIEAIVVLPDHFHIMMTLPEDDADFSSRLSLIKRRFTTAVLKAGTVAERRPNGEIALWQRRFWEHTIRNEKDFERHVDYIHFNPVKHELVTRVRDWPHSSFHRYVRLGVLPRDWAGDARHNRTGFGEPKG
jgi:REP-associated tyrosine transposase